MNQIKDKYIVNIIKGNISEVHLDSETFYQGKQDNILKLKKTFNEN